jgi:fatty-acyl-CoA synthase
MAIGEPHSVPLSPLMFLDRAADVFRDRPGAVRMDGTSVSYRGLRERAVALAAGLSALGKGVGDRVAILAPNGVELLEAHFGIPASGAAIVAMNTRLAPSEYAHILRHAGCRILIVDERFDAVIGQLSSDGALDGLELVVRIGSGPIPPWAHEAYEPWLTANARPAGTPLGLPSDELQTIAVNYTSGTTGLPRGVLYSHRGAYLNSVAQALHLNLNARSVLLWTLPMFHCNGWCFTWGATAVGATHVCLPSFVAADALDAIDRFGVTHFCGAPVVMNSLADLGSQSSKAFDQGIIAATGGAPPTPEVLRRMKRMGVDVLHLYGLTETYGPSIGCEIQADWDHLDTDALALTLSRQGVRNLNVQDVRVLDGDDRDVPHDATAVGEIAIRASTVMLGYLDDEEATRNAFRGGYFRTGDLAVVHEDGYIEIRDRQKDIIISGGENISSVEVENVLAAHPAVHEVAVVARADARWGEVPVAFVTVRDGRSVTEEELVAHVRERLAGFKVPKAFRFQALPHTSTGKIRKAELRALLEQGDR